MKTLRSILAVSLCVAMTAQTVQALPFGASGRAFSLSLPSSLGYVSSSYSPASAKSKNPDFILIQDLHVNRSVQFAISGILKQLKKQGLMPDRVAVEGESGPVDIQSMQAYPDPTIRKKAAAYLVTQGEMPGAMHFAVSEGEGALFGIETEEYYQANLEMFRRSYHGRSQLRSEIEKIQAVLPKLLRDPATRENASLLSKDLEAVSLLINNQVVPDELLPTLSRASEAVIRLKLVLPKRTANELVEPLSASINFYSLALLRNEELFKNSLALRQMGRQKTTIVVAGGFHTEALTELCKKHGFSYAVITPNLKRHGKADEKLYVERLLGHHLTPDQVATGQDWTRQMIQPMFRFVSSLWPGAVQQTRRGALPLILTAALLGSNMPVGGTNQNVVPGTPPAAGSAPAFNPPVETRSAAVQFSIPKPIDEGNFRVVVTGKGSDLQLKRVLGVRFIFPPALANLLVSAALSLPRAGARSNTVQRTVDSEGVITYWTGEFMDHAVRQAPNGQWVKTARLSANEVQSASEIFLDIPGNPSPSAPLRMELVYPVAEAPRSLIEQALDSIFGVPTHAQAPSSTVLLRDDFNGTALDETRWVVPQGAGTFLGRTQMRPSSQSFEFRNGILRLPLDTYNPSAKVRGDSFYGSEIDTRRSFPVGQGLSFATRARLVGPVPGGLVASLFGYALDGSIRDEIDFELMSNDVASQRAMTTVFKAEGFASPGSFRYVPHVNLTDFNTYEVRWFPDRVQWFINGQMVREEPYRVPTQPMTVRLNFWAPAAGFAQAFNGALLPAANARSNQTFYYESDWVEIRSFGGASSTPRGSAPTALAAAPRASHFIKQALESIFGVPTHAQSQTPDPDKFRIEVAPGNPEEPSVTPPPVPSPDVPGSGSLQVRHSKVINEMELASSGTGMIREGLLSADFLKEPVLEAVEALPQHDPSAPAVWPPYEGYVELILRSPKPLQRFQLHLIDPKIYGTDKKNHMLGLHAMDVVRSLNDRLFRITPLRGGTMGVLRPGFLTLPPTQDGVRMEISLKAFSADTLIRVVPMGVGDRITAATLTANKIISGSTKNPVASGANVPGDSLIQKIGRAIVPALMLLVGVPALAFAQEPGESAPSLSFLSNAWGFVTQSLSQVSPAGWGIVLLIAALAGGVYGVSRKFPASLADEPASTRSTVLSGIGVGLFVLLLGGLGWGALWPVNKEKSAEPVQDSAPAPDPIPEPAPAPEPATPATPTETAPAPVVETPKPLEPIQPEAAKKPEPVVETPKPVITPAPVEPTPAPAVPVKEDAAIPAAERLFGQPVTALGPVFGPNKVSSVGNERVFEYSNDYLGQADFAIITVQDKTVAPYIRLVVVVDGKQQTLSPVREGGDTVYNIDLRRVKGAITIQGHVEGRNQRNGEFPVIRSYEIRKDGGFVTLGLMMAIGTAASAGVLAGTHFAAAAVAAGAIIAVVGMIFSLRQKQRDKIRTESRVLAGLKRMNQAVRATPGAISGLAAPALGWIKNSPIVAARTRQKTEELAKQAALWTAA